MSTKFTIVVPASMQNEVLQAALKFRDDAAAAVAGKVYIAMDPDEPEVEDPTRLPGSKRAPAVAAAPAKGRRGAKGRREVAAETPAARASVVYQPLPNADPDSVSPTPRRLLMYLMRSRRNLTAREFQEWLAGQDHTTADRVRKSVESSLHLLRTKGLIRSVQA